MASDAPSGPNGTPPLPLEGLGEEAAGDALLSGATNAAPALTGWARVMAIVFGKEAAGYAALLVFSLATITGSMYVLSSRETDLSIRATVRFEGGAFTADGSADFSADTGVRTVIVSFDNGVVSGIRDAVTSLAGAIRAVSSNIIDEARREEAARAAAQAARASTFGLSADTQLVAQAPALSASAVQALAGGVQPTPVVVQPTTAPAPTTAAATGAGTAPTVAPTQAPAPTTAPTTQAVVQAPTQAPAQSTVAPTQTPVPPTATPVPPTSVPQSTEPPSGGGTQPTSVPAAATSAPAAATSAPAAATSAPAATAVPAATVVQPTSTPAVAPTATLIPTPGATSTPVPVVLNLLAPAGTAGCPTCVSAVFTLNPNMNVGDTVFQQLVIGNGGTTTFSLYMYTECPTCGVGNPLWDDATNGLQLRIIRSVAGTADYSVYQGRVNMTATGITRAWVDDLQPGRQNTTKIELSLPTHASDTTSNTLQGKLAPISFIFQLDN